MAPSKSPYRTSGSRARNGVMGSYPTRTTQSSIGPIGKDAHPGLRRSAKEQERSPLARLVQRLGSVRRRLDQAYQDKLDGKISEEFWERKAAEWQAEEQQVQFAIRGLDQAQPERLLDGVKILELANKAYFLYLKQPPSEKAKLLKIVLSNCSLDAASLYPTYRKPFDVIFARAKNEEWRARRDSNSRPSGS